MSIRWCSRYLVAAFALGAVVSTMAPAHASDWPQTGFDSAHTGFNPNEVFLDPYNVGDLEVLWTNGTPCTIRQGVSVADGIAYYGHYCGDFRAVDAETGALIWEQRLDGKDVGQAVVNGVAYVASIGAAYAFDAATGASIWTWDPESIIEEAPVLANGMAFLYTSDDVLHMLDAASGVEIENVSPGGFPAVSDGIVYVSRDSLRAYSIGTLELLWTGTGLLDSPWTGRYPVVADGLVYAQSDDGYMNVYRAGGCGEEFCPPLWRAFLQVQTQLDHPQIPAVGHGKVFVGANGDFHAFPADGCGEFECDSLWTTTTGCDFFGEQPSVANGVVYSVCDTTHIHAFDASNGDILWQYYTPTGYAMRSPPVIVDGRLFHDATFDFTLYAFHVPGSGMLGVDTYGLKRDVWGVCANFTTGQSVWIFDPGRTSMDCGAAGLDAAEDDVIVLIIRGLAE